MQTKKTTRLTWFALALCVAVGAVWITTENAPIAAQAASCPPTDPVLLNLPANHQRVASAFKAKAQRLNAAGICVIEGSWGANYQRYYYAVFDAGKDPKRAYFLRYTADELNR